MSVKIYHNPRCSKSKQTLDLLYAKGIDAEVVFYLDHPLRQDQLLELMGQYAGDARDLIRFKEDLAKDLKLSKKDERTNKEWASILAKHPYLLERPIVVSGGKVELGRPPENVLKIL